MISKENYDEQHIRDLQVASKGDPGLIERTLYAFGLLEALVAVGLNFTFKGGTSLLLLLPKPKRLSTDIDIVVDPGTDISSYIEKASHIFPFTDMEEQERVGKSNIVKNTLNSLMILLLNKARFTSCWTFFLKKIITNVLSKKKYRMNFF